MHGLKRSCHSYPSPVNGGNYNTPSMHHPRKWLDYKMATYAKISLKMVNPTGIAGNAEAEEVCTAVNSNNYPLPPPPPPPFLFRFCCQFCLFSAHTAVGCLSVHHAVSCFLSVHLSVICLSVLLSAVISLITLLSAV